MPAGCDMSSLAREGRHVARRSRGLLRGIRSSARHQSDGQMSGVIVADHVLFQNSAEYLCRFSIVMIEEPAEPLSTGDPT